MLATANKTSLNQMIVYLLSSATGITQKELDSIAAALNRKYSASR